MIRKTIYIFIISFFPLLTYSQIKIDKQEILSKWREMEKKFTKPIEYKNQFDSLVVDYIDRLKLSGVDTIGAYLKKYVGAITVDSCKCGATPWIAYIQWIKNGHAFHQKITECCKFEIKPIERSVLIRYYDNCRVKIDKESIMPVITGASYNNKGEMLFHYTDIDHTTLYSIYCDLHGKSTSVTFEKYELESEANLFHTENLNSNLNSWRKIIDNQIDEIEAE